jgi:hypothetical protein
VRRLLVATALLAVSAAPVPAVTAASSKPPSRAQVSADEFTLALSRSTIRRGPAILELVNYGEDDHDLALRRVGGSRTLVLGVVGPGGTGELETRLAPGRYTLWCTLTDHRARGMHAMLRVTAR